MIVDAYHEDKAITGSSDRNECHPLLLFVSELPGYLDSCTALAKLAEESHAQFSPSRIVGHSDSDRFVLSTSYQDPKHRWEGPHVVLDTLTGSTINLDSYFPDFTSINPVALQGTTVYAVKRFSSGGWTPRFEEFVRFDLLTREITVISPRTPIFITEGSVSPNGKTIISYVDDFESSSQKYNGILIDLATGSMTEVEFTIPNKIGQIKNLRLKPTDDGSIFYSEYRPSKKTEALFWNREGKYLGKIPGDILGISTDGRSLVGFVQEKSPRVDTFTHYTREGKRFVPHDLGIANRFIPFLRKNGEENPDFNNVSVLSAGLSPNGNHFVAIISAKITNDSEEPTQIGVVRVSSSNSYDIRYFVMAIDLQDPDKKLSIHRLPDIFKPGMGAEPIVRVYDNGRFRLAGASPQNFFVWDSERGYKAADRNVQGRLE